MNLTEKIKNMFQKKKVEEVAVEEVAVEEVAAKEIPAILPEELIIPGETVIPVLNLYRLIQKTEEDIGRQLMKNKQQEQSLFKSLKKLEDITQERVTAVKLEMGIPEDNDDYELVLPGQTGKDGKFVKIKR